MNTKKILIIEDDLETLSFLNKKLALLEEEMLGSKNPTDIAITVFSEYTRVDDYLNHTDKIDFDVVLLDRDCKLGGSFHVLDLSRFDKNKIIAISTNPEYNEEVTKLGVKYSIEKDYKDLDSFTSKIITIIKDLIDK